MAINPHDFKSVGRGHLVCSNCNLHREWIHNGNGDYLYTEFYWIGSGERSRNMPYVCAVPRAIRRVHHQIEEVNEWQ
jgi:hypothetical protein